MRLCLPHPKPCGLADKNLPRPRVNSTWGAQLGTGKLPLGNSPLSGCGCRARPCSFPSGNSQDKHRLQSKQPLPPPHTWGQVKPPLGMAQNRLRRHKDTRGRDCTQSSGFGVLISGQSHRDPSQEQFPVGISAFPSVWQRNSGPTWAQNGENRAWEMPRLVPSHQTQAGHGTGGIRGQNSSHLPEFFRLNLPPSSSGLSTPFLLRQAGCRDGFKDFPLPC